ncbi:hypothetical protein [Geodermatophilus sp. SYSU D01036]
MADLTIERASGGLDDGSTPPPPAQQRPSAPPPAPPGSVALTRLLALARLTAPQALELSAGVLEQAAQLPVPDTGTAGRGLLDRLAVGTDGQVVLHPSATPAGPAVAAVLTDVAATARSRPGAAEAEDPLLDAVDAAVAALPDAGVPPVARRAAEAAAAIDRGAVRAELGALVRSIAAGGPVGAAASAAARGTVSRPVRRETSRTARRVGAWLLSVVVLAAAVTTEVVLLRDEIAADVDVLLDAGRSGVEPTAEPTPDGVPVTPPAPASAGSVAAVDLRGLDACEPGQPCTVRVQVRLVPDAAEQRVTWSYLLVDRCTGDTSTAPGGTIAVPPGGERAEAVGVVALPPLPAVAVLAVTDSPATAASAPLSVGSCPPELRTR